MKQDSSGDSVVMMAETERRVAHAAFFDALGTVTEADAEWRPMSAGLLVLRLVDSWLDGTSDQRFGLAQQIRAVREAVDAVPAGTPVRGILAGVVDSIEQLPIRDLRPIAPRLMAYGRSLEYDAAWRLASDVYQTIIAYTHPAIEPEMTIDATMRQAFCFRTLGELGNAELAYSRAGHLAAAVGDHAKMLHARIGDAKMALVRGNLPAAESILDETLDKAKTIGAGHVRAMALHERAMVAHARGEYERAIRFAYDALQLTYSLRERDRVLLDISMFFMDSNVFVAARDALMVLAATAQEQYVRWAATLNLMEIAAREGSEPIFELYRRQLDTVDLPIALEVRALYCAGLGYSAFGHSDAAIQELERAREAAARHSLNQQMFEAEALLAEVRRGARLQRNTAVAVPESVYDVAEAMSELREQLV
jgi:tetratricopeptide (TPR) repeat protein